MGAREVLAEIWIEKGWNRSVVFPEMTMVRRFPEKRPAKVVPTAIGAATMGLLHAAIPDERWFVDLLVSAAVGTAVYAGVMFVVGLTPTERTSALGLLRRR